MRQESVEYLQKIGDYVETQAEKSMIAGVLFVDLYVEVYMLATLSYIRRHIHAAFVNISRLGAVYCRGASFSVASMLMVYCLDMSTARKYHTTGRRLK